jgi:hypothetical protein
MRQGTRTAKARFLLSDRQRPFYIQKRQSRFLPENRSLSELVVICRSKVNVTSNAGVIGPDTAFESALGRRLLQESHSCAFAGLGAIRGKSGLPPADHLR